MEPSHCFGHSCRSLHPCLSEKAFRQKPEPNVNQPSAMEAMEKFQHSVRRAKDLLAAADEARAQAGFGSRREAQEFLERQLSAQEIADVDDAVAQEMARIRDEVAAHQMPGSGTRMASGGKRHLRQML